MPAVSSRGDAVGGAARAGDDLQVLGGLAHALHDGGHRPGPCRRGQDDETRSGLKAAPQVLLAAEGTGALQDQVDAQFLARQPGRIAFGVHRHRVSVDARCAAAHRDRPAVAAVVAVVRQQVGEVVHLDEVVDGGGFHAVRVVEDLQRGATDAAEPVDGDLRHPRRPSGARWCPVPVVSPRTCPGRRAYAIRMQVPVRLRLSYGGQVTLRSHGLPLSGRLEQRRRLPVTGSAAPAPAKGRRPWEQQTAPQRGSDLPGEPRSPRGRYAEANPPV